MFFSRLSDLNQHIDRISSHLQNDHFYVVGGVIRDLLMGTEKSIIDVDITGPNHPDEWRNTMKSDGLSRFRTEKFGTMTMVRDSSISYEITPFRQEGGYEDFRHPGEIQRSNSLLDDAKRRDFTVNCLYYRRVQCGGNDDVAGQLLQSAFDSDVYVKQGYRYDEITKTLCVCNDDIIDQLTDSNIILGNISQIIGLGDNCIITHLIIDPYQGLVDIVNGILRCVGNPDHRFQEDALRILRGLRFVNTFNQVSDYSWDFHRETWRSMQKYHFLVQRLAKERIRQELVKVFSMNNPFGYVAFLDELKLLSIIFPAVAAIKGLDQPVRYHPLDTYHHTLMTLWHVQKINTDYRVKLAMLYHDVGKIEQYKLYTIGLTKDEISIVHGTRLNHTVCGPDYVRRDFAALGFSNAEIEYIAWLVQYHMYPGQILMAKSDNQRKKIRALLAESSYEQMCDLFDIVEGDRLGHYNPIQSQQELDGPQELRKMLHDLYHHEGQITLKSLAIDGTTLMEQLGIPPSKVIGQLLHICLEEVLRDPTKNTKEALLDFVKKYI